MGPFVKIQKMGKKGKSKGGKEEVVAADGAVEDKTIEVPIADAKDSAKEASEESKAESNVDATSINPTEETKGNLRLQSFVLELCRVYFLCFARYVPCLFAFYPHSPPPILSHSSRLTPPRMLI